VHTAFKAALAEADYQRREYIRVKEGKKYKTSSTHKPVRASTLLSLRPAHHYVALETTNIMSVQERSGPALLQVGAETLKTQNGPI